ncbi:hypothetical protein DAPPUDRAFT_97749 [Daphnia pulex]|uniref:Uncharacterized protein n=1 Tax=Daphnia pulex TaxID=6669 RepID=E9G166_DAPPU|nr:hypothetical protein DAPPUDRAFT_97749 [Daphnia pulex]|eukprot:EFX86618.1 hypothetical protein DAPPUDRAFT_97749 [Daphnia pulex]
MTMLQRSFIGSANPAAAFLLLLISILTWSSCSLASPFSQQPDTTTATTELTQLLGAGEIQHTAKGSDGVAAGILTTVTTTGTCKAILPDGRLQTVVYTCAPTGYSAVVQFHKAENQSATHEQNHQTNTRNAPADVNATTQQQQPLQPITEILFLRPTTTDSSARLTTTTTESPSITTSSAATPTKKKPESMVAIVPPHRFHIESDQIRTVSLVQLQHSLPSLPLSTTTSRTTTLTNTKRHRSTTTVSAAVEDGNPAVTTTPAATNRRRKTRWNIGSGTTQSEPPLV